MRPLSASEAITPAIEHTKALLRPFSLRLWLKLGLVAVVAELGGGQFISPPLGNFPGARPQPSGIGAVAGGFTPVLAVVLVVALLVGLLVGLALFYLGSRLQLVLMDLVATRTTYVAPAWHRTASRTWRWIWGKLACFFLLLFVLFLLAAVPLFFFFRSISVAGSPHVGAAFLGSIILFGLGIFFFVLIILLVTWLLRDFVLPYLLFQDASFGDALRRTADLIRSEPGPVAFYLFLKLMLTIIVGIAAEMAILVTALVAAIPTGIAAFVLWTALHHDGPLATAAMYFGFVLLGLLFAAAIIVAGICFGGAILIFYQAYALYFLGGRIPQIGALLEPPPPYYPSPSGPPPAPIGS